MSYVNEWGQEDEGTGRRNDWWDGFAQAMSSLTSISLNQFNFNSCKAIEMND